MRRPLRGIVAGAGLLGPYWARELVESPDTALCGWVDLDPKRASAAAAALGLLRGYKVVISPFFTGSCRYYPSCADYMREALLLHGVRRGVWLGIRRLSRCHPLGGHGVDPVPQRVKA